ncbi:MULTISPECIES: CDGSH iron-sulfur domain-containing protein [Catenuloplanes]|uniref:CDGSH-type Zn-finger protein n=1 Tax=Catenuloplanes niger TaxID=587534 RepID=A0AAE3ZX59_9ACTN|nr:hypothetical protein [Catenuloplanes niger]MDR7327694.1 CDGSH-type Zn-finger protein [Catenuloplanes niger]
MTDPVPTSYHRAGITVGPQLVDRGGRPESRMALCACGRSVRRPFCGNTCRG